MIKALDYANAPEKKKKQVKKEKVSQFSFMGQFRVAISTFKYGYILDLLNLLTL